MLGCVQVVVNLLLKEIGWVSGLELHDCEIGEEGSDIQAVCIVCVGLSTDSVGMSDSD